MIRRENEREGEREGGGVGGGGEREASLRTIHNGGAKAPPVHGLLPHHHTGNNTEIL